ncbi:plasmid stabilization system protein [Spirochaetia bacterium]|nr:plasmid stabilization system protein [Spirochaetia bacterium]
MKVVVRPLAAKYVSRLNAADRERIKSALANLEKEPPEGDIFPISGQKRTFRLRVGSFRAIFRFEDNMILVTHIESRGQVYKKKNKKG